MGLWSCKSPDVITYINRNSTFILTAETLAATKNKALRGDSTAAFEVFAHYSWGLRDDRKGEPWLRLADRLRNRMAKDYLEQWRIAQPSKYAKFKKEETLPKAGD
jgi:hypothetical protein